MSRIKGQIKWSAPGQGARVTLRMFGPREEHKVWSNRRCRLVIISQDHWEVTEILSKIRVVVGQSHLRQCPPKRGILLR